MSKKRKAERAKKREQEEAEKAPNAKPIEPDTVKEKTDSNLASFTEEQRKAILEEVAARKRAIAEVHDKLEKETLTKNFEAGVFLTNLSETEKQIFFKEVKDEAAYLAQLTETGREEYWKQAFKEVAAFRKMTPIEREAYWKQQQAEAEARPTELKTPDDFVNALGTALEQRFTRPQDFRSEPFTEEKKAALRIQFENLQKMLTPVDGKTREALSDFISTVMFFSFEATEPMKSYTIIDKCLRTLLGDSYFSSLRAIEPQRIASLVKGLISGMSSGVDDIINQFPIIGGDWLDTVLPTLDMIFQQRYNWPEGTANKMSINEMCMALETAIEQDDPKKKPTVWDKPNIWDMTRDKKKEE